MSRTVLVVDDEASIRNSIEGALKDEGYHVVAIGDPDAALPLLAKINPDIILLDIWMTNASGEKQQAGLELLSKIKTVNPDATVIMMSGHGTIETAVKATKIGAIDFIEKPLSLEKLLLTLQNALRVKDLARENQHLRQRVEKSKVLVGESPAMKQLQTAIRRVAPTNSWVLITGENGTGKELVANMIHSLSNRFDQSFVEVNCAAIPEELIESELFGHEKGSFTGATQMKRGKFDLAHHGTLFLDEIGDMSLKTQAKVLRILQEQRFERVGGTQTIEVDVRVVAATNKNLEEEIQSGKFRQDLYHRLNVVPFHVPALRNRKEDISHLAEHFLSEFSAGVLPKRFDSKVIECFQSYVWPGNVRELKNLVERITIFSDDELIDLDQVLAIAPHLTRTSEEHGTGAVAAAPHLSCAGSLKDAKSEFEKEFILRKLFENEWNVSKTAQALGIERSHLHKKIKAYGIEEKALE